MKILPKSVTRKELKNWYLEEGVNSHLYWCMWKSHINLFVLKSRFILDKVKKA